MTSKEVYILMVNPIELSMITNRLSFSFQSSYTTHLVCNILRSRPSSVVVCKSESFTTQVAILHPNNFQLESFWQQLIAKETYFTAHGICRIDRSILTTVGDGRSRDSSCVFEWKVDRNGGMLGDKTECMNNF